MDSGGFRGWRDQQTPLSKQGVVAYQHGLWPWAVTMRPFVPRRSISLPLLKILYPPLGMNLTQNANFPTAIFGNLERMFYDRMPFLTLIVESV